MKYLVIRPSFSSGNVGDHALIKTIQKLLSSNKREIIIPKSQNELNKIDLKHVKHIIYFGNDCIPYYHIKRYIITKAFNMKKKIFIINTSWGKNPKTKNVQFLKYCAKNPYFQIFMRDQYSYELIQKDIKFHNKPILTADLAFLCLSKSDKKDKNLEEWIKKQKKNDKLIIGINIHKNFGEYNKNVRTTIHDFIQKNDEKYSYLFIPHDSRKKEYEDLHSLSNSFITNNSAKNKYVCKYLDPEYEKYITNQLYLVITGRMHLAILTIPNGVPTIGIAYNGFKMRGSFKHWNIENLVINPANIKQELYDKINDITENYDEYVEKINNSKNDVENLIKNGLLTYI